MSRKDDEDFERRKMIEKMRNGIDREVTFW